MKFVAKDYYADIFNNKKKIQLPNVSEDVSQCVCLLLKYKLKMRSISAIVISQNSVAGVCKCFANSCS